MAIKKISTVSELQYVFATYCNGPRTKAASGVPKVRSSKLTAEDTAILNDYIEENTVQFLVDVNVPGMLEELFGLKLASPEDIIFLTVGAESFTASRNQENRKRTVSRIVPIDKEGTYSNLMKRGMWATLITDSMTWDWYGQAQTAQHRGHAFLVARNKGIKLPLAHCSFGHPAQFKDWMDKAKSASKTDDTFKDKSVFPREFVSLIQLHETGIVTEVQSYESERKKLIDMRSKVMSCIANRLQGKDIPKTGGKQSWDQEQDLAERFGLVEIPSFNRMVTNADTGEESISSTVEALEGLAIDYLIAKTYEAAKSQNGKLTAPWTNQWNPSIVVTGLVLASNGQDYIDSCLADLLEREAGETIEEFSDRQIAESSKLLSPESSLRIDWELVDKVLTMLKTSVSGGGPLGNVIKELIAKIDKHRSDDAKYLYAPMSIPAMSAFVQLVKNIVADDLESSIFTTYKANKGGEYSPAYRCFGGRDIGYQSTEGKKKKKDE